jgi:hypothetical protein
MRRKTAKERMMRIARKILLGAGAAAASMLMTSPANAYYVVYYNYINGISGAEMYCDDGTLYSSGGLITSQVAYIEYHTGEAPC